MKSDLAFCIFMGFASLALIGLAILVPSIVYH